MAGKNKAAPAGTGSGQNEITQHTDYRWAAEKRKEGQCEKEMWLARQRALECDDHPFNHAPEIILGQKRKLIRTFFLVVDETGDEHHFLVRPEEPHATVKGFIVFWGGEELQLTTTRNYFWDEQAVDGRMIRREAPVKPPGEGWELIGPCANQTYSEWRRTVPPGYMKRYGKLRPGEHGRAKYLRRKPKLKTWHETYFLHIDANGNEQRFVEPPPRIASLRVELWSSNLGYIEVTATENEMKQQPGGVFVRHRVPPALGWGFLFMEGRNSTVWWRGWRP